MFVLLYWFVYDIWLVGPIWKTGRRDSSILLIRSNAHLWDIGFFDAPS